MFHSIGRVGAFLHHADAASWQGNGESAIAKSVVLGAEGEA